MCAAEPRGAAGGVRLRGAGVEHVVLACSDDRMGTGQLERTHEVASSPNDGNRRASGLSLHKVGSCSELVGDARHRHHERPALGIRAAAQVVEHSDAGRADRGIRLALAPRAPEGVADDDADLGAGCLA